MDGVSLLGALFALLWIAFVFAQVEIAIEGAHGWAERLPTWRLGPQHWASKLLTGGRPLTGYHFWMNIFVVSMLHISYLMVPFSLHHELFLVAFYFGLILAEDFFWFVFNPAFGLRKFHKEFIWWHAAHWWIVAPRDYYLLVTLSGLFFVGSLLS